ncbi:uncharacterized protein BT62DRAFT_1076977 [Guyanagaster necrorhizus]|uniref:Uncharacterized protein n=1 Tax=Guyanagaster necrorhizus TaxID=856835 RepID=A0A9P7VRI6_9AGAR|nr:uncharacterized protein BT62DRAFT_1076977 [Guyanagaster necrorhizus MCA 3950]KAG7445287.1 hypothetical protein BT62DRAFT_1076977 [Guyanagaster necrorhizus MCA 3950]
MGLSPLQSRSNTRFRPDHLDTLLAKGSHKKSLILINRSTQRLIVPTRPSMWTFEVWNSSKSALHRNEKSQSTYNLHTVCSPSSTGTYFIMNFESGLRKIRSASLITNYYCPLHRGPAEDSILFNNLRHDSFLGLSRQNSKKTILSGLPRLLVGSRNYE